MGLAAVDAVLLDSNLLLELLEGGFSLGAELAVRPILGQAVFQLQQELLQRLHVRALGALLHSSGAEGIFRLGRVRLYIAAAGKDGIAVVHEGQLEPVRPLAGSHLRFDTAVVEPALLDSITAADIHAHMPIRAQRHTGNLRQGINGSPSAALVLGVGEHAVGRLVGTAIAAILAGELGVSADGLDDTPLPPPVQQYPLMSPTQSAQTFFFEMSSL